MCSVRGGWWCCAGVRLLEVELEVVVLAVAVRLPSWCVSLRPPRRRCGRGRAVVVVVPPHSPSACTAMVVEERMVVEVVEEVVAEG